MKQFVQFAIFMLDGNGSSLRKQGSLTIAKFDIATFYDGTKQIGAIIPSVLLNLDTTVRG